VRVSVCVDVSPRIGAFGRVVSHRLERRTHLEDRGVHNVHEQHRLEEGVGELRLALEQLPRLVRLRGDECLRRLVRVNEGAISTTHDQTREGKKVVTKW
jgi:hypothetical protein